MGFAQPVFHEWYRRGSFHHLDREYSCDPHVLDHGLSVVTHLGDQVLLDCGGQNLALIHIARAPLEPVERQAGISNPLGRGHHAFRVSRADFAVAPQRLAAAGVECAHPISWGDYDCLYFLDLDGNLK